VGSETRDTRHVKGLSRTESHGTEYLETSRFGWATHEELNSEIYQPPASPEPDEWKPAPVPLTEPSFDTMSEANSTQIDD
jgi:hypothetical protein